MNSSFSERKLPLRELIWKRCGNKWKTRIELWDGCSQFICWGEMAKVPGIFFSLFIMVNHHLSSQKRIRSNSLDKIKWRRDYFAGLWIKKLRFKARQGHCVVFSGKKLYSLRGPPLKGWTIMEFSRNAESYVQWTGIHPGCPYSRSKEFEVSPTLNELLSPEEFTDNPSQINARNSVLQHFST